MTTYIAFHRGINVGAYNRMKMDELRAVFESLGYDDVETYIQSGNAVFETSESDEEALREDIHDAVEDTFGYDISVMIRTRTELQDVVAEQPFDVPAEDGIKHYITFLNEGPTDGRVEALLNAQNEAESFVVSGREVYSELDKDALGDGRFTDAGKILGMEATRRNWSVVTAVQELSE
ncbi:DUF1697 domain-containing protein [Natrinema gelatinilyticum]|uniref:DUF1697 domain-containing protein n=1 Tax=Natrinema gelatinilyticum TaxID=2961571 RepID=UPI0020C47B46|nr:DUF1697 domain-containing protein [Natrinema gelatinilyticum]